MKVYVASVFFTNDNEGWVLPHSYKTLNSAVQGIEAFALEAFEKNVDPNTAPRGTRFPGLVWNDDMRTATTRLDDSYSSEAEYTITETDLL